MQLMVEGDKWEMYIPSELGYGDGGQGGDIGPGDEVSMHAVRRALLTTAAQSPHLTLLASSPVFTARLYDGDPQA